MLTRRLIALFVLCGVSLPAQGTSHHHRITDPLTAQQSAHLAAEFDTFPNEHGGVDVIVLPEEMRSFKRLGFRTKLIARGRPFAQIAAAERPDTRYYTATEILAKIDSVAAAYPQLAKRVNLSALPGAAKTHNGQNIYALKVSDNVATEEKEPSILLAAEHHARELNAPVMVIGAMERVLKGYATDPKLKSLVDEYELFFVPCVNPDGTDYVWTNDNLWRKNRRNNGGGRYGVDNNRNYPFLWGRCGSSTSTSSQIYRGPSPASEPETRTMMALQRIYRPEIYLDVHSSGREVLFTYAPCATVNSTIRGLIDRYKHLLRNPMSYAHRAPSASGEAPEYHWSEGTMSFLIEVMTSFQPSYSSALTEEARVWKGFYPALTTWRPAVRGHVTSIFKNQPVTASIRYTPNLISHGEGNGSRARDGRYAMWLPLGSHSVTWSATGFRSVTKTIRITNFDRPQTHDIVMVPNMPLAVLTKSGTTRIGMTTALTYTSTGDIGETYWVVLAVGESPGIPLGAGRVLPLNADALFFATLRPNALLLNNTGLIPPGGKATASFVIPNLPGLVGITVYAAGVTQNNDYLNSVKNFSSAISMKIQR